IEERLAQINFADAEEFPEDLLVFYHRETLGEIVALRKYLRERGDTRTRDFVDDWIGLVALNRLTGHSNGFFSVYTMPPNQAVSAKSQRKINERRGQVPPRRNVREIILKKSRILLSDCDAAVRAMLGKVADRAMLLTQPARATPQIAADSIALA